MCLFGLTGLWLCSLARIGFGFVGFVGSGFGFCVCCFVSLCFAVVLCVCFGAFCLFW